LIRVSPALLVQLAMRHRGELLRVARVMGAAVISRGAQLGAMIVVARKLGPTDYGLFIFATGASVIAGMLGCLGWQLSFNRFFAIARREDDPGHLRGLVQAADRVVLGGNGIAAVVLLVTSALAGKLAYGLVAAAILTVPTGLSLLRRQQLAGVGQAPFALMLDQGFASIALLVAVMLFNLPMGAMFAVYGVALVAGNLAAGALFRGKLPPGSRRARPIYQTALWMRSSLSLMLGQVARIFLARLDVLLLPTLSTLAQAGLFGAAVRVTFILSFPQFILQTVTGPQFAEAFAAGDAARARRILWASLAFALVTTLPLLAIILIAPEWVMRMLFGTPFAAGAATLVLVALGEAAGALALPFTGVLTMAGREPALGKLNVVVLIVSLAAALVLIPAHGALGAGIVSLTSGLALLVGQILLSLAPLRGNARSD